MPLIYPMAFMKSSSAWTPANLPGLHTWLRADLGITIGTGVSTWTDQSGNGHSPTNATGAQQPTVASADINGKDAIKFVTASTQWIGCSFTTLAAPRHIFAVCKSTDTSGSTRISSHAASAVDAWGLRPLSATNFNFGETTGISNANFNSSYAFWEALSSGASSSLIKNAGTAATGTPADTVFNGLNLGSYFTTSLCSNSWIAEYIICTQAISGSDLTSLRSYMTGRYGFP